MKNLKITELTASDALLVTEAQQATALSYAPYSKFHVGAALLLANGEVIRGANQENASYPCGICAERSTLATAQNMYPGVPVMALALAAKDCSKDAATTSFVDNPVTPCGMCRQVISETEKRYGKPIHIIMTSNTEAIIADGVSDILPLAF